MSEEIWKPFPRDHRFEISSIGRVRNAETHKLKNQSWVQCNSKKYLKVYWNIKGKLHAFWVHRLVCETFHGPPPEGMNAACHVPDDDPANNRAENVAWGTRRWNESHKNGGAPCICNHIYADHHPEHGWCTGLQLMDTKLCECQGFQIKRLTVKT